MKNAEFLFSPLTARFARSTPASPPADERALVFFTCWLEIIKITFADAAPEMIRKSMAKYGTSMWLFMACFIVFIYDERFPDLELRFITIRKTTYSSSDVCFLSGMNYILFLTVFIVHTLR